MHLYAATAHQFLEDTVQNRIAEKLSESYVRQCGRAASPAEIASWRNSLRALCNALSFGDLLEAGIILEYQLPLSSKRLDCLLVGRSPSDGSAHAVVVELKQWERAQVSETEDCVIAFVGGRLQEKLHPSRQALDYADYLADSQTAFTEGVVALSSCSYLHNLQREDDTVFGDARYAETLARAPLFAGDETDAFISYLHERIGAGDGQAALALVTQSRYRASKKLLEHVAAMLRGEPRFVLLDEQRVVYNEVVRHVLQGYRAKQKVVVLVKGGPGTGKSVLALNLVGDLARRGYNAQHATGSRAFTENIRKAVGSRAGIQFKYFNSYMQADRDEIDVLVADEAHRLRPTSNNRYTRADARSDKRQIDELLHVAKVSVFFIDDLQVVRPGEVGSAELIRQAAVAQSAKLVEYELEAQFRCGGSDGFINWVDHTLDIRETANQFWNPADPFEFRVVDDVHALEHAIRAKAAEGHSARLVAGFCWPWSDATPSGELVNDVTLEGGFAMPWNAKPESTRLAAGIPKSHYWATDANGLEQVGCVYTAQGFEFDYVGVIFGRDLVYDPARRMWVGQKQFSEDPTVKRAQNEEFVRLVKHIYRVLLTRGLKSCYVYFQDEVTRDFVRSRIRSAAIAPAMATVLGQQTETRKE